MEQDIAPTEEDLEFDKILKILGPIRQHRLAMKHKALRRAQKALQAEQNKLDELNQQFKQEKADYQVFKTELLNQGVTKSSYLELQLGRGKEQKQMQKLEDHYQKVIQQEPVITTCEDTKKHAQHALKQQQKSCERLTMLETLRQE